MVKHDMTFRVEPMTDGLLRSMQCSCGWLSSGYRNTVFSEGVAHIRDGYNHQSQGHGYIVVDSTVIPKTLGELQDEVYHWAKGKGWEPDDTRTFGDECALMHSEISEALEAFRDWGFVDQTHGTPAGVGVEFADILIRWLHYTKVHGFDPDFEYERKMAYNRGRPFRHGGKVL